MRATNSEKNANRFSKPVKKKVIRARCDDNTENLIKRAAGMMNLDISDFIRIASTQYATQVTASVAAQMAKVNPFIPFA